MNITTRYTLMTAVLALGFTTTVDANPTTKAVDQLLNQYKATGASNFSAERGQRLWVTEVQGRRCTNCHTEDPRIEGRHQKTKKAIAALAPSANGKRLQEIKTIRKWLKRNCKWTLGRECSAQEKGDFLTWLSQQ